MGEKEDKNTEQAILKAAEEEFLKKGYALRKLQISQNRQELPMP